MNFKKFVDRVAEFEGFSPLPYKCPAGVWTIGYGRTKGVTSTTPSTTREKEYEWLSNELYVIYELLRKTYEDYFNYNQRLALTSFYFNCGRGNFLKLIDNGMRTQEEISDKITAYNKASGKVLAGLVKRRAWEKNLFDTPVSDYIPLLNDKGVIGFEYDSKWWTYTGMSYEKDGLYYAEMIEITCGDNGLVKKGTNIIMIPETDIITHKLKVQFFGL